MDVRDAVSLEAALREFRPNDDDRLDPLASSHLGLERVAESCGGCSKPTTVVRRAPGRKPVSGDDGLTGKSFRIQQKDARRADEHVVPVPLGRGDVVLTPP